MSKARHAFIEVVRNATPARRWAFGLAVLARLTLLVATGQWMWMAYAVPLSDPHLVLVCAGQALISATIVVELLRVVVRRMSSWSDRAHFKAIGLLAAALSILTVALAPRAYYSLGIRLSSAGDHQAAIDALSRAIELDPEHSKALYRRGWLYAERGDYEKAVADLSAAIVLDPREPDAYIERAWVRGKAGDVEGQMSDYDRAIELDPDNLNAHMGRAYTRLQKREYARAVEDYTRALEIEPDEIDARIGRGKARFLAGDVSGAKADWSLALVADPGRKNDIDSWVERSSRSPD
jgi:tetratricopeptide (TPR) repeat protein